MGKKRLPDLVARTSQHWAASPRRAVYRLDAGYGGQPQVRWLKEHNHLFVLRAHLTRPDKWALKVAASQWQLVSDHPGVSVADLPLPNGLRAVVVAMTQPKGKVSYSVLLSNLPAQQFNAYDLWTLYNGHQSIEAFFKSGRGVYGLGNLRSRKFKAIHAFMWLMFISHNLLRWVQADLFAQSELANVGIRELVEKVGRIPARCEPTAEGLRLYLPSRSAMARLMVSIVADQADQQDSTSSRLYKT